MYTPIFDICTPCERMTDNHDVVSKETGEVPTSFVTLALKKLYEGKSPVEEDDIKHTSATTYAGKRRPERMFHDR